MSINAQELQGIEHRGFADYPTPLGILQIQLFLLGLM